MFSEKAWKSSSGVGLVNIGECFNYTILCFNKSANSRLFKLLFKIDSILKEIKAPKIHKRLV